MRGGLRQWMDCFWRDFGGIPPFPMVRMGHGEFKVQVQQRIIKSHLEIFKERHGKDGNKERFHTFPRHYDGDLYESIHDICCTWNLNLPTQVVMCWVEAQISMRPGAPGTLPFGAPAMVNCLETWGTLVVVEV